MEGVQHIDGSRKFDGVNTTERVAVPVLDDFEHPGPAEPLERLGIDKLAALLGEAKRESEGLADIVRTGEQVVVRAANGFSCFVSSTINIPVLV